MFRETYLAGRGKEERLYSQARFQSSVVFRIPKPGNPRFLKQNKFSDSGIRSPLNKAKLYCSWQSGGRGWGVRDLGSKFVWAFSQGEFVLANCLPVSKPLSYSLISQLFQLPWARKRLPPFSFPRLVQRSVFHLHPNNELFADSILHQGYAKAFLFNQHKDAKVTDLLAM